MGNSLSSSPSQPEVPQFPPIGMLKPNEADVIEIWYSQGKLVLSIWEDSLSNHYYWCPTKQQLARLRTPILAHAIQVEK
ncbi:hypothetical protein SOVF_165120 [Spinacia oleracea]|nr:hypothetical protein SOVF_165120 [Spinacia oleracea]